MHPVRPLHRWLPVSMKTALNIRGIIYQVLLDADIDPREMDVCGLHQLSDLHHPLPKDIHPPT